jgi:hypothetical protein
MNSNDVAADRGNMMHHHVLEIDDSEGSSRIKGIELKINIRDVPVR